MPEPDRVLYFGNFSGLHSQHAANHALLHSEPGDFIGSVMMTFRLGVSYVPLILAPPNGHLGEGWLPIVDFPHTEHVRNHRVRLWEVTSTNPFELEADDVPVEISQWFPAAKPETEGVD